MGGILGGGGGSPVQQQAVVAPTPPVVQPPLVMPIKDPLADKQLAEQTQAIQSATKTTRANTIIGGDDTLG